MVMLLLFYSMSFLFSGFKSVKMETEAGVVEVLLDKSTIYGHSQDAETESNLDSESEFDTEKEIIPSCKIEINLFDAGQVFCHFEARCPEYSIARNYPPPRFS